jgi:hypothetical protein
VGLCAVTVLCPVALGDGCWAALPVCLPVIVMPAVVVVARAIGAAPVLLLVPSWPLPVGTVTASVS